MLSQQELGKYLAKIRQEKGISLREVNKLKDVSYSHLSMIEHGKRNVTPALLRNLADLYGVDYLDLYEKAGYIDLIDDNKKQNIKIDKFGNPVVSIPLLGSVKAGYDYLAQENWQGTVEIKEELAKTGDFFALKVKGDSMFETLWEDDIVAVKKQDFAENNQIVVAIINGDEATVKRYKVIPGGIMLQPLNKKYDDLIFTENEIEETPVKIIGVVKQIIERNFN